MRVEMDGFAAREYSSDLFIQIIEDKHLFPIINNIVFLSHFIIKNNFTKIKVELASWVPSVCP